MELMNNTLAITDQEREILREASILVHNIVDKMDINEVACIGGFTADELFEASVALEELAENATID